jgi:hypothetical protein
MVPIMQPNLPKETEHQHHLYMRSHQSYLPGEHKDYRYKAPDLAFPGDHIDPLKEGRQVHEALLWTREEFVFFWIKC